MRFPIVAAVLPAILVGLTLAGCGGGAGSASGNSTAPSITTQPANQTVARGQRATFTVVATGTAPLTYQWQENGAAVSGAMSSTYTTPPTTSSDNGSQFKVVVSNPMGSVTSNAASLTVTSATLISLSITPTNPSATVGGKVQFMATGT